MLQNSTVFNAQNAGNRISELLGFNFFWGACPQTPLGKRGLNAAPLEVNQPPITPPVAVYN